MTRPTYLKGKVGLAVAVTTRGGLGPSFVKARGLGESRLFQFARLAVLSVPETLF